MRYSGIIGICGLIILFGCKASKVSTKTAPEEYTEELSTLRPDLTLSPGIDTVTMQSSTAMASYTFPGNIRSELDSVNRIIIAKNTEQHYLDGFTIQIYTGNDRDAAYEARDKALLADPTLDPVISYHQPGYKVKVGQYTDRLQAHKVYTTLKTEFPLALLIPERIQVDYD